MAIQLTTQQLKQIFTSATSANVEKYIAALNKYGAKTGVFNTKNETAMFLAQVGHESGELAFSVENLNYSTDGLLKTFPKYFNSNNAANYARQPQKIANRVYANRMGNGDEASGDGWANRGKGLIQITGKNNVLAYAKSRGMTYEQAQAFLLTVEGAVDSAFWFWQANNLSRFVDTNDFLGLTKAINGGTNGLPHRTQLYKKALTVL